MLPRASLFRAFIITARTRPRPRPRTTDPTPRLYSTTRPHYQAMAAATDTQAAVEADASGVTPESITATLKSKLDASHVEIEDMSGKNLPFSSPPHPPSQHIHSTLLSPFLTHDFRRLRTSLQRDHRVGAIRVQDPAGAAPARQLGAQGRDRGHSRLDAEMLHAGAVGEGEGEGEGAGKDEVAREGGMGVGCCVECWRVEKGR